MVRIPGSHPGGPGSIPGNGNFDKLFLGKSRSPSPSILLRVSRAIYNNCELFKTADICVKCLSVGVIEKAIPLLALYTTPVELMLSYLLYDVVPFAAFFCRVSTWLGHQSSQEGSKNVRRGWDSNPRGQNPLD